MQRINDFYDNKLFKVLLKQIENINSNMINYHNLNDHYVASIMLSEDPVLSVVDLYEDIKKECKLDNLNNKLKKIFLLLPQLLPK